MRLSLVFLCCFLGFVSAGKSNKQKVMEKAISLGIKFVEADDLSKGATCMEPSFYECKSMDDMKNDGIGCAMQTVPMKKYYPALKLKSKLDDCLKPNDAMSLVDKLWPTAKKLGKKLYNKVMGVVKKAKNNKKSEAYVLDKGYKTLLACVTKKLIEEACKKMLPYLNKQEWDCLREIANDPEVADISQFKCPKIEKKA